MSSGRECKLWGPAFLLYLVDWDPVIGCTSCHLLPTTTATLLLCHSQGVSAREDESLWLPQTSYAAFVAQWVALSSAGRHMAVEGEGTVGSRPAAMVQVCGTLQPSNVVYCSEVCLQLAGTWLWMGRAPWA